MAGCKWNFMNGDRCEDTLAVGSWVWCDFHKIGADKVWENPWVSEATKRDNAKKELRGKRTAAATTIKPDPSYL